jgi:hypothetical protein
MKSLKVMWTYCVMWNLVVVCTGRVAHPQFRLRNAYHCPQISRCKAERVADLQGQAGTDRSIRPNSAVAQHPQLASCRRHISSHQIKRTRSESEVSRDHASVALAPGVGFVSKLCLEDWWWFYWIWGSRSGDAVVWDVTSWSPTQNTDVSEEHTASIFRVEE